MYGDTLNWHNYGGYTEMTALSLNINAMDKEKSKRIIVQETLSQSCSTDKDELKKA